MSILELSSNDNFDELIKNKLVLVYFSAPWCMPCKSILPIIEDIDNSEEYKERLFIIKINIDKFPKLPARYRVRSVPSIIILKNEKSIDSIIGFITKDKIYKVLNKVL